MARRRNKKREPSGNFWSSFVLKGGSKLLLAVIIILAFLTLSQCTVKKPASPEWDTKLVVPIINRTYPMEELIRRVGDESITIDSTGAVTYSITEDLDTVSLDEDLLSTGDLSCRVAEQVGPVKLAPPHADRVLVNLSSISGLATALPGDSATVSPVSFDLYNDMPTVSSFSQIDVASGELDVGIDNNLGVDLDTAIVEVYDVINAAIVATDTVVGGVPSGARTILPVPLNGKTISNRLRVDTHCSTPGGDIDSASTRYVATELMFPDSLEVTWAIAEVPALSRQYVEHTTLAENDRLDSAILSGGTLNTSIGNGTSITADLTVVMPDLVSSGGSALTVTRTIGPRQSVDIVTDLSGYRLVPRDGVVPQELDINVYAATPGTNPQQVQISQSDSFFVQTGLAGMRFSAVTGVIDSTAASFDEVGQNVDLPPGFEALHFVTAILVLEIENGIDLPGSLSMVLQGDNGKTSTLGGQIAPGSPLAPTVSVFSDTTVADFLSPPPSYLDLAGSIVYGDGFTQGTVTSADFVSGQVRICAPLEVIIDEARVETEVGREKIQQDHIDVITDHFIAGRFYYNIVSHLPIAAHVGLYFSDDSTLVYTQPLKAFDSLYVVAAPTGAGGIVIDTASTGYQEIALDSADVRRLLENETLYTGLDLLLEGSGGQSVKLTADDYIAVTGRVEIDYRFDGDL